MTEATTIHPTAYIVVGTMLLGALIVTIRRNILHAIFGLALVVFSVGLLFLYLGSPFVAAMQILIYVGGIAVAMVFAVMFSYTLGAKAATTRDRTIAIVPVVIFFTGVFAVLRSADFATAPPARDGSVAAVGRELLTTYALPFEALSAVLLLAIAGAIIIARRDREHDEPDAAHADRAPETSRASTKGRVQETEARS